MVNREIKFRAWDRRRWLADNEWGLTPDGAIMVYEIQDDEWVIMNKTNPPYKIIPMQYTGLKDSKGREIYEGDIVKHPLCVKELHNGNESCETFIGKIVFEVDRGQWFAINTKRNGYVIAMTEAYKFEVIGNIYENPALLANSQEGEGE